MRGCSAGLAGLIVVLVALDVLLFEDGSLAEKCVSANFSVILM